MKKYVFESLKFFCAAILCTILTAFATPSWGALPSGYTELEYVNMPEGAYLLTDIVPTYDGHYELEFAPITLPSTGGSMMGGRSASYPAGLNLAWNTGNTPTVVMDGFSTNRYTGTYAWVMGTKYKYTWNNKVASISTGGSTVVENTFTGTNTNGGKLYINAMNNQGDILGNSATINVYSFSAWDSAGAMVGNFVPAKNSSGVIGMYDTVSGQFFTNSGSGSFLPGEELSPCRNLFNGAVEVGSGIDNANSRLRSKQLIPVEAGKTYILSAQNASSEYKYVLNSGERSQYPFASGAYGYTGNPTDWKSVGTTIRYTATKNGYLGIIFSKNNNSTITISEFERDIFPLGIQLEVGSTATSYVPYNATCDDRCKNLFDKSTIQQGLHNENGVINNNISSWVASDMRIPVTASQTYTVMADATETGTTVVTNVVMFKDNEYVGYLPTTAVPFSFTPDSTYNQIELQFAYEPRKSITKSSITNIQLERGSTATAYVPYCETSIKIATTKYNESAFSPLNTALANAISVVDTVVSNTITQAGRIATLQAQKQTRPNDIADDSEKCPAGKKCLLVEDASGVPHWYEIVERYSLLPDGYTELEYIQTDGNSWIDTGYIPNGKPTIKTKLYATALGTQFWGCRWTPAPTYDTFGAIVGSGGNLTIYYGLYGNEEFTAFSDYRTGVVHTFELGESSIIYDGLTTNISRENISSTYSFVVGGFNNNGEINQTGISRIYSMEVKESGNMMLNLIPAKNASGVVGMYDTVSGTFFTNAGSGTFVAGDPVVE